MSCATHRLDGGLAMKVEIKDTKGNTLDTFEKK